MSDLRFDLDGLRGASSRIGASRLASTAPATTVVIFPIRRATIR
jgi:hypothetical protein